MEPNNPLRRRVLSKNDRKLLEWRQQSEIRIKPSPHRISPPRPSVRLIAQDYPVCPVGVRYPTSREPHQRGYQRRANGLPSWQSVTRPYCRACTQGARGPSGGAPLGADVLAWTLATARSKGSKEGTAEERQQTNGSNPKSTLALVSNDRKAAVHFLRRGATH